MVSLIISFIPSFDWYMDTLNTAILDSLLKERIQINSADIYTLMLIPSIGYTEAKRIVNTRGYAPIRKLEDLKKIGFSQEEINIIKPYIDLSIPSVIKRQLTKRVYTQAYLSGDDTLFIIQSYLPFQYITTSTSIALFPLCFNAGIQTNRNLPLTLAFGDYNLPGTNGLIFSSNFNEPVKLSGYSKWRFLRGTYAGTTYKDMKAGIFFSYKKRNCEKDSSGNVEKLIYEGSSKDKVSELIAGFKTQLRGLKYNLYILKYSSNFIGDSVYDFTGSNLFIHSLGLTFFNKYVFLTGEAAQTMPFSYAVILKTGTRYKGYNASVGFKYFKEGYFSPYSVYYGLKNRIQWKAFSIKTRYTIGYSSIHIEGSINTKENPYLTLMLRTIKEKRGSMFSVKWVENNETCSRTVFTSSFGNINLTLYTGSKLKNMDTTALYIIASCTCTINKDLNFRIYNGFVYINNTSIIAYPLGKGKVSPYKTVTKSGWVAKLDIKINMFNINFRYLPDTGFSGGLIWKLKMF